MSTGIALVGNPNCGKTTLFNELTGCDQYVGNWPGVTVEKKEGTLRIASRNATILDLPGIYSLYPYSAEERIARDVLLGDTVDVIINVVDATNLERHLYLTMQLIELGRPMVVALNMADRVAASGMRLDIPALEKALGVPMTAVCAADGTGLRELVCRALDADTVRPLSGAAPSFYDVSLTRALERAERLIAPACHRQKQPLRVSAIRLLDRDAEVLSVLRLSSEKQRQLEDCFCTLPIEREERDTLIAREKYRFISRVCDDCIDRTQMRKKTNPSDKIDAVLTNRFLAFSLFFGMMALIFYLTFGPVGTTMTELLHRFTDLLRVWTQAQLTAFGAADWAVALVCDGVLAGVGAVVGFFPQIGILFFCLSFLEDSGYMARAAFLTDHLLCRLGLSGRSFVPMLMGFGCSVPAMMATRTLENERDRRLTMMLIPFMSCSAKMPIYALFVAAFFPSCGTVAVLVLYGLGLLVAALCARFLNKTVFKGEEPPFLMELPCYRLPTPKTLGLHLKRRVGDFAVRAGTLLLLASVIVWLLCSFSPQMRLLPQSQMHESILAAVGRAVAPLFIPLGFGTWEAAVSLLSGLAAKEAIVSTLTILLTHTGEGMTAALAGVFTPVSAASFLTFVLLYMPCMASFSVMRREMNSWKWAIGAAVFQTTVAWGASFVVYQIGLLGVNLVNLL